MAYGTGFYCTYYTVQHCEAFYLPVVLVFSAVGYRLRHVCSMLQVYYSIILHALYCILLYYAHNTGVLYNTRVLYIITLYDRHTTILYIYKYNTPVNFIQVWPLGYFIHVLKIRWNPKKAVDIIVFHGGGDGRGYINMYKGAPLEKDGLMSVGLIWFRPPSYLHMFL